METTIPTVQRVKSVTGRRFGGMERREKARQAMPIAEGISGIAIIEVKTVLIEPNLSNGVI